MLQTTMHDVDQEMKRTDALLYQMIPKAVAVRLRNGEPAINTCQVTTRRMLLKPTTRGNVEVPNGKGQC